MKVATIKPWISVVACVALAAVSGQLDAQGIALRGVGSINESMAGASTALPLSAGGALHWNPATISAFECHQAEMGIGLIYPDARIESTVGPFTGSSRSESGASPIPTMAVVLKGADPRVTWGIGVFTIAGFKLNYDSSTTNPLLFPQGSLGPLPTLGRLNTESEFFQIVPTVSYALNDCWSIGASPTLTIGRVDMDPLFVAAPGPAGYPSGSGTRYHFGGGAQFGLYGRLDEQLSVGMSVKTEQYFEPFGYKGQDANGQPVNATWDVEYPLIVSLGAAYRLNACTTIASDVRWFDYGQARGFGDVTFNPDFSLLGLSWQSVMAVATGVERHLTDRLTVRGGYVWNENPISTETVFVNAAAPLNLQHLASAGFSYRLHPAMRWSVTYLHAFDQASSGPYAGVPGTDVTIRTAAYLVSTGVTIDF